MEILFILLLLLPIPVLLNRWRGTGAIITIGKFRLIGNIIYALYIAGVVGLAYVLTYGVSYAWLSVGYGLLAGILYIAGESFAWGKWIGWLVNYDGAGKPDYENDDGRSFPYIHYIAQAIVKQESNYTRYCEVALAIRGLFWWLLFFMFLYTIGLVSGLSVMFSLLILSFGFPTAAHVGNYIMIDYKSKYLNLARGWENQEIVYGFFQWIAVPLVLLINFIQ